MKLPPRLGIAMLLAVATSFGANHVAARVAFDNGVSVPMAVLTRATGTALFLFMLMRLQRLSFAIPAKLLARASVAGILVAVQSYCLYSAVAIIPVALALLVFQVSPIMYVLLSWVTGKDPVRAHAFVPMLLALFGLALALDVGTDRMWPRWAELGAGVAWALSGAVAFALMLYSNAHLLPQVDGRLRTLVMTGVAAMLVFAAGAASGTLIVPHTTAGWVGLATLTVFYGAAMTILFIVLPRISAATTIALNFEPIAVLCLGWIFLGQSLRPGQTVGVFTVSAAIAWLGFQVRRS
jgi:drug/metabolite transporter (DMT)-like permease